MLGIFLLGTLAIGIAVFAQDKSIGLICPLKGANALLWVGFVLSIIVIWLFIVYHP